MDADLDDEMRSWMAFAVQKVGEVATLAKGLADGREAIADALDANDRALDSRRESSRTSNAEVRARIESLDEEHDRRSSPFEERRQAQRSRIDIPELFPSTTIGSYPQTDEIRQTRQKLRKGEIDWAAYKQAMEKEIEKVIRFQEEVGLDVLVHGEPERNDMVQYFGEQMEGYVFTENAWVQSYGSRYVRPPIIFGDVLRPSQMTVDWITYAQSLTDKPVKGMLTGPVTMLEWSFVRADQPLADTCKQLALAIRDEVEDLEKAGVQIIQVDEPAIREGLPLRKERWDEYLGWAVHCFRLSTAVVEDRDPDPDPHVLLGLRRHPRAHPGDGRRRQPDRGGPLADGAARATGRRPATATTSARASTTSTHRGCRPSRRWSSCSARPRACCARSRSGSTRTAA